MTHDSTMFVQYVCGESQEVVDDKRRKLWILSFLQVLTLLCFVAAIYYLKKFDIANKEIFQSETVNIGDYTVKFEM